MNVLICGATSAIGQKMTSELIAENHFVFGSGRTVQKIEEMKQNYLDGGIFFEWDFARTIEGLPVEIPKETKFDAIIFCAGDSQVSPVLATTQSSLEATLRINFSSIASIFRLLLLGKFLNDKLSVVFVSSFAATHPSKGQLAYASSKACLEVLMKVLIQEFSFKKHWKFNLVSPAQIESPMNDKSESFVGTERAEVNRRQYPFGLSQIEDVTKCISFLLDEEKSAYLNGVDLTVDGGLRHVTVFK